jgi:hypothetical protein
VVRCGFSSDANRRCVHAPCRRHQQARHKACPDLDGQRVRAALRPHHGAQLVHHSGQLNLRARLLGVIRAGGGGHGDTRSHELVVRRERHVHQSVAVVDEATGKPEKGLLVSDVARQGQRRGRRVAPGTVLGGVGAHRRQRRRRLAVVEIHVIVGVGRSNARVGVAGCPVIEVGVVRGAQIHRAARERKKAGERSPQPGRTPEGLRVMRLCQTVCAGAASGPVGPALCAAYWRGHRVRYA